MKKSILQYVVITAGYVLPLAILPFFIIRGDMIVDAVRLTWGVMAGATGICWLAREKIYGLPRKIYIMSAALTVVFAIMLSFTEILQCGLFQRAILAERYGAASGVLYGWAKWIYLPMAVIAIFLCMCGLLYYFLFAGSAKGKNGWEIGFGSRFHKKKCFMVILAASVVFLFSTFPGIWISDDVNAMWQWVQTGYWSNWHTLGYNIFVYLCTFLFHNMFAVNVCHTILWLLLNYYLLGILEEYSVKAMGFYTCLLAVSITPFVYLEVAYKDVVFSMGMLALTASLWNIIRKEKISAGDFVVFSLIGSFATLCRHMGWIAPLFGLMVLTVFLLKEKKYVEAAKGIGMGLCHGALYVIVYIVLMNSLEAEKVPQYVSYGTPMAMIGAAVQEGVVFDPEDVELLERVMPLSEWGACYNKYWADDISRNWGKIGERIYTVEALLENEGYGGELIRMNAKLLLKHPAIYIRALFDMNSMLWEIGKPVESNDMSLCSVPRNEEISYLAFYKSTDILSRFCNDLPLTHSLFWRGGASVFAILFSVVVMSLRRQGRYVMAAMPIIIYGCMLAIVIPAQDPRFILPMIECAIFILALVVGYGSGDSRNSGV